MGAMEGFYRYNVENAKMGPNYLAHGFRFPCWGVLLGSRTEEERLKLFGFKFNRGGAHMARTSMYEDLFELLRFVGTSIVTKDDYRSAIVEKNCLGKRSVQTRLLTFRHLVDLYALDMSVLLYRALVFYWERDAPGRQLIALLCAYARDSILRATAPFILGFPEGALVSRTAVEVLLDEMEPGRFSEATLKSIAQNINSSWTKSGHLSGRTRKVRVKAVPTAGSVSYALLLGYLKGARGPSLFQTEYAKLLDCPPAQAMELAETASRKGWIVFKRIDNVMEVSFPTLLGEKERGQLLE